MGLLNTVGGEQEGGGGGFVLLAFFFPTMVWMLLSLVNTPKLRVP